MRTIQIGGLLAAGVVLVGLVLAPAASADESPSPNSGCGAALLALTSAEKAVSDATAADKAAADAKSADDALADATAAVNTTRAAALAGGVTTAELADNAATARARKVVLLAIASP